MDNLRVHLSRSILLFLILLIFLSPITAQGGVAEEYSKARKAYHSLMESGKAKGYRHNWMNVIDRFQVVYKKGRGTPYAPKALYMIGRLYTELFNYSHNKADLKRAIDFYRLLVAAYSSSSLADDAQFHIGEILERLGEKRKAYREYQKVVDLFPKGDMAGRARERLTALRLYRSKKGFSYVSSIRHWSNPNYTRVVIDLTGKVSYRSHLLKEDPSLGKPPRLYIDLFRARLKDGVEDSIPIKDGLLKRVRTGQHNNETVRVVLDLESLLDYKVFSLDDPFRVVVDIRGTNSKKRRPPTIAEQLRLKVKRIVIDPGHGGKDPGAIGRGGLKEKDVVLRIGRILKDKLRRKGYHVMMTRDKDTFIPLEERTAFANTKEADLFISIHANASPRREASGIETYYLNLTTDEEAIRVAARENATSGKKMSDLQFILYDLMQTSKINESSKLASLVQTSLISTIRRRYSVVHDLGVKQAPFYVLIGANMPSILVEVSFISNPREERRLRDPKYLEALAEGIMKGIERYIEGLESIARR